MSKLVRDRIPELMRQAKHHASFEILAGEAYLQALRSKLGEEAAEAAAAIAPEDLAGELGDLLEVMETLAAAAGVDWGTIRDRQACKRRERGGFAGGVWLVCADSESP